MKKLISNLMTIFVLLSLEVFLTLGITKSTWSWPLAVHQSLAKTAAKKCVSLPSPKKVCNIAVDEGLLYTALMGGAIQPDLGQASSPKHAFNPEFTETMKDAVSRFYGVSEDKISAGLAIQAKNELVAKLRKLIAKITCNLTLNQYEEIWRQFGFLSHFPTDIAVPLHVYSVNADGKYREGDLGLDGNWYKGIWECSIRRHSDIEGAMAEGINTEGLRCYLMGMNQVAQHARDSMVGYTSKRGIKGYQGLMDDYLTDNYTNYKFFKEMGQNQASYALGGICSVWKEALQDWKPPQNCECQSSNQNVTGLGLTSSVDGTSCQPPLGGCGSGDCEVQESGSCRNFDPGGDYPDDTFSVSTLSSPPTSEEILEQAWNRLAVKKNKKSLIWYSMQEYLLEEFYRGNIDEETYQRISSSYGLTADVASELFYNDYITTPDVAILGRGFALSMSDLLQSKLNEPIRRFTVDDFSPDALKDYPIFIIPSAGLMGLENSDIFKVKLDEYVKQGGTLIVFAQQHGYEFSGLPVPQETDGTFKKISGYGWSEDQSCFYSAAYIETWHQILAGQSKTAPNFHMDGYFTSYPSNATVLLRRTANGQPALLLYEYGQGKVIVNSMYSDFALKQNQVSTDEISLIRDMISWAKRSEELPEIKPGESVTVSVSITNNTNNDSALVKVSIYNPDRSALLSEETASLSIPTGQSITIPVRYTTTQSSALGIYHIDYTLYDSSGTIIQPQAETDSGRFVVSCPPTNEYKPQDLLYSINTPTEYFLQGQDVPFTVNIWNNSNADKRLKLYWDLSHSPASSLDEVTVAAYGTLSRNYTVNPPYYGALVRLWVHFFEENGTAVRGPSWVNVHGESWPYVGSCSKGITVIYPSANVTVSTNKTFYAKGEMVAINTSLKNDTAASWQTNARITITDHKSTVVFEDAKALALSPNGTGSVISDFALPLTSLIGTYTVRSEALYEGGLVLAASTKFELPQSQITEIPNLSQPFPFGSSIIPFTITNTGDISVSSGVLDVTMKDPDGNVIFSDSYCFAMAVGESKTLDIPISIPSLKLGNYTLTYSQSDETRTGIPANITIPNSLEITNLTFDKISYKIREAANLIVDLKNTGKFNVENVSVTVSGPDASYIDTKTISVGVNPNTTSLNFTIPIPEIITAGQHNVNVTVALSSGANFARGTILAVPESALVIGFQGPATVSAGDTINLTIENSGGVDTTYTTEKLSIKDSQGVEIYNGSVTETIRSGEKKTLTSIQVPSQSVNGAVFLTVEMKDSNTRKRAYFYKALEITGLIATLQTRTDKDAYLKTEAITGTTRVANELFRIEGGSLKLSVTKGGVPTTGNFSHFLPKKGWWSFHNPYGVAIGPDGSVFVADTENNCIQKFDSSGGFITKWGSYGDGDGQFQYPYGIAVGPDSSVYVADALNARIQKFDSSGSFITKWGSYGNGDGQFQYPYGIAVGPDGSVYVADTGITRIQKFDSSGSFITKWGSYGNGDGQFYTPSGIAAGVDGSVYVTDYWKNCIQKFDSSGSFITKWGGYGNGNGQFQYPEGIAVGQDGSVYVGDTENYQIQKFDPIGRFITKWGSRGNGDGQFNYPTGLAVGLDGSVYVADIWNNRIQKFSSGGSFITKWGTIGSKDGEFCSPKAIAVAPDGSVYVADSANSRIQKFDKSGNFILKWGHVGDGDGEFDNPSSTAVGPDGCVYIADSYNYRIQKFDSNGNFVAKWGSFGSGNGEFQGVEGIAIGLDGWVYVSDTGNNRIQKFDTSGNFLSEWKFVLPEWQFNPTSIGVGPDGSVYVVDLGNYRVQKFDNNGNLITSWEISGECGEEVCPTFGIAVGPDGSVYVSDEWNNRIQKFDGNGNLIAEWGSYGSEDGQFDHPENIAVAPDGSVYVADTYNSRIQKMIAETLFETTLPISQPASTTEEYITSVGTLNTEGKLYLQATLKNSLGQTIAQANYPFYVIEGNTVLLFNTDKKIYKLGETVTITGQVENRASIDAEGLALSLHSKLNTQDSELVPTDNFYILAGGTHPFMITTTAGTEGTVTLTGKVTQNNSILVEIADQYEVTKPNVSVSVAAPDIVGNERFQITVEMKNTGKVNATVQFGVQSSEFGDSKTITISPGETKLVQYQQQVYQTTAYIFTFSGDLNQTITKSVTYGLGATIQFGVGSSEFGGFPEGNVGVPFTITNTGQLTETVEVSFELNPGAVKQSKTYSLPQAGSTTNTLYFNLTEGDYQLTASSQLPTASARASFSVRKENKVEMTVSLGTQTNGLIPVTVNLNNIGYNEISGSINVNLSPSTGSGQAVWNGEEALSQLQPKNSQLITFNINPSAIQPGDYGLRIELLNNSGQSLDLKSSSVSIQGPIFQITQLPPYQTFIVGQEATFTFKVKNNGNQEGPFDLRLKAYDLIDSTQRQWLNPNGEKVLTFGFTLPENLEEKDYFADYELKGQVKGQIKYHLGGINLNVNANLDKPYYTEGETAHLTINIQSTNPNPQNLFARVNYAGYGPQQTFTLNGSQVLIFDVPLPRITGEKLFYGIYHESGRSIHLNSLYIHKAGDVITITTDKQVYNPGETVSVSVSGSASGNMTLSAPGGYTETFAFSGQSTRNFTLPSTMTASTYFINVQLSTPTSELITVAYPFDVAGIQMKFLECQNDKGKYASSDTITTNFTISSNTAMPAILKAWIVDPEGQYSRVGESKIDIFSSENSLTTLQSPLLTSVSGIHRLMYGIYTGDLLLASGSEAFDVGDAVLIGLYTDKMDYPAANELVNVKISIHGMIDANLELQIDGIAVRNQTVNLNGFSTLNIDIGEVKPGVHVLRGILTAGGLRSIKETSFIYGSRLPDLIIQLSWDQAIEQSNTKLTITAVNQGKIIAGPTTLNLYDGMITAEKLIATLGVNALPPEQSQILSYNFNLLGRAGSNTIYAVIDPNNTVLEFNESNNEGQITFQVPELTLFTALEKEVFFTGDSIVITGLITNLSKAPSAGITLNTNVRDVSDVIVFTNSQNTPSIYGSATITITVPWQTDINLPEGSYIIQQAIEGKNIKTQKTIALKPGKDFTITSDIATQRVEIGEMAQYSLTLTPIRGFSGEISLSLEGYPQGCTAYFTPNPVSITGENAQSLLKVISADPTSCGSYSMTVNASGGGKGHDLILLLDLTDFQIILTPANQTIQQLDEATFTIILNPLNGFDSPVTLEVDGIPRGMRANLSATQVTLPKEVTLTLEISKWLLSGQYAVDIIAKGRTITHTATATLVVNKNPLIPRGVITAPGPGPKNKAIINTFRIDGTLLGQFQAVDTRFGANLTAGDVEGDGIDEIIVGTVYKNQKNPALLGIFKRDGTTLAIKEMDHRDKEYGLTVASGDIDGDWIEEVVVGYYTEKLDNKGKGLDGKDSGYGVVKIYQYRGTQFIDTGLILYPYEKERYKTAPNIALADVDGDGVPELVTAPGPDPNALAKIKVFKIDTREGVGRWKIASQLAEFVVDFGEKGRHEGRVEFNKDKDGNSRYGANIAAGDIDGDGREEIIVGAGPDPTNTSVIKVYRGDGTFTGIQFTAFPDQHSNHGGKESDHEMESHYRYGVYVAAGDVDEDGISEIIAGTGPDPKNEGWVRIFNGDGTPMGNGFLAYPEEMKYGVRPSGINLIR